MKYRCFVLIIISYNFLWTYDYTGTYRLHCGVNNDGRCDTVTNTLLQGIEDPLWKRSQPWQLPAILILTLILTCYSWELWRWLMRYFNDKCASHNCKVCCIAYHSGHIPYVTHVPIVVRQESPAHQIILYTINFHVHPYI